MHVQNISYWLHLYFFLSTTSSLGKPFGIIRDIAEMFNCEAISQAIKLTLGIFLFGSHLSSSWLILERCTIVFLDLGHMLWALGRFVTWKAGQPHRVGLRRYVPLKGLFFFKDSQSKENWLQHLQAEVSNSPCSGMMTIIFPLLGEVTSLASGNYLDNLPINWNYHYQ